MRPVRFITFSDVHISSTNPASRVGNYFKDILDKLYQIGLAGKKLNVDFYILGGDLYHFKSPARNTHELNRSLIEVFQTYEAPIYCTEGNHDLRQDSYETFGEQPLSVLYATNTLNQIRNNVIQIGDITVRLRSFPFNENPDLSSIEKNDPNTNDVSVNVLHLYSGPKESDLFGQKIYSYPEIAQLNDNIYVLGHYHIDQGISVMESSLLGNQYFINLGAISRGSLTEDEITRSPKIGFVTIEKEQGKINIKAQAIKLKVKDSKDVFDVKARQEHKEKIKLAEDFVNHLQDDMKEISDKANSIDVEIENSKLDKEIVDRVKHYLAEADLKIKEIK